MDVYFEEQSRQQTFANIIRSGNLEDVKRAFREQIDLKIMD